MKAITFNFRSEQEEKVLLDFLDSHQYVYEQGYTGLSAENRLMLEEVRKRTREMASKLLK